MNSNNETARPIKTAYTKGEWKTSNKAGTQNLCRIINQDHIHVADCFCFASGIKNEEAEANAKLIAAAPNLLEACIWAKDVIKKLADEGKYPDFLLKENGGDGIMTLVDAINKAIK